MAVIPGARRGDVENLGGTGESGSTLKTLYHISHIEQDLRESFRQWFESFTPSSSDESTKDLIQELELAEFDVQIQNGSGGYYQRVLQCLCKNSKKLSEQVCTRSSRSGLVSLIIDLSHLRDQTILLKAIIRSPTETTILIDDELKLSVNSMIADDAVSSGQLPFTGIKCVFKNHPSPKALRNLDPATDMLSLVSIKGICLRLSTPIPEMQVAVFSCMGKASRNFQHVTCGNIISRPVINGVVEEPLVCEVCQSRKTFILDHDRCVHISKQLCKLQEHPDEVVEGEPPQMIFLYLYDNLVDNCKAGDVVSVVGIYKPLGAKVASRGTALKGLYKIAIDVLSIHRTTNDKSGGAGGGALGASSSGASSAEAAALYSFANFTPDFIASAHELAANPDCYNILMRSFAPEIWGLEDVKRGLLCQLFGGVSEYLEGFHRRLKSRGEIHILLCGDPAVAKSQLVRYVNKLCSRSVYVVGSGATSAGMTASIIRDPETRETLIESGAILLSDNGICCIDEFDKMEPTTRAVLYEVMEQQTISFAKAGIISSLNARTSILASANPIRSRYDKQKTIVENINLPSNLMTRFDLIFLCLDLPEKEQDRKLSNHVCNLFSSPEVCAQQFARREEKTIDPKFFAKYLIYAKATCQPKLTQQSQDALVSAYVDLRKSQGTTIIGNPRQLDSLIRIATALAKMRLKTEVDSDDVREANRLIKVATYLALTDKNGRIDYDQLVTGKSTLQRERQSIIAGQVLTILEKIKPDNLSVDAILQQVNQYLHGCSSGKVSEISSLGISAQDAPVIFAQITRLEEIEGVLRMLEAQKHIGPCADHTYTFMS